VAVATFLSFLPSVGLWSFVDAHLGLSVGLWMPATHSRGTLSSLPWERCSRPPAGNQSRVTKRGRSMATDTPGEYIT